jgi:hypothetical protein
MNNNPVQTRKLKKTEMEKLHNVTQLVGGKTSSVSHLPLKTLLEIRAYHFTWGIF